MDDFGSRASRSHFSHSIFQPTSARSTSTIEEDNAYQNTNNYDNGFTGNVPRLDIDVSERHHSNEDINFNFEANISPKEDINPNMNDYLSRDAYGLNSSSGKSQKLNSLANNMTSLAMSPGTKTPLVDLENAFHNLKHKTPINQVRKSPQNFGKNVVGDTDKTYHLAATKIQKWFKRHISRKKAGSSFFHT